MGSVTQRWNQKQRLQFFSYLSAEKFASFSNFRKLDLKFIPLLQLLISS